MADFRVILNTEKLDRLDAQCAGRADHAVGKVAAHGAAYVISHFSTRSPSAPGEPPGVRTGALKNSISFGRLNERQWYVGAGTDYAAHLEFGTTRMAARPFMLPMMRWLERSLPPYFAAVFEGG